MHGDEEILERARRAANGVKFSRLWAGDTSEHNGDDSSADLALLSLLAFYTGPDPSRQRRDEPGAAVPHRADGVDEPGAAVTGRRSDGVQAWAPSLRLPKN